MNNRSKLINLAIAVVLVASLLLMAGCGGGKTEKTAQPTQPVVVKIDLATVYDKAAPPTLGAAKFKELVEQKGKGAIKVNLFTNGALGSEKDTFNLLSGNELQMILGGIQGVDQFAPQYMFVTAPYLIKNWAHIRAILEGDLGKRMIVDLDKKNVHMLATNYRGIRNTSTNKPFTTPAEMKGLKLRLPEVASWVAAWKGLGAMPTPIALPELYGALQTNVVDASEGPFEQMATFKLQEVQKYVVRTQHIFEPCWLYISKKFLDSLPKEQQEIIVSSAKEAMLYADKLAAEKDSDFMNQMTSKGVKIIDPDLAAFRAAAQPMLVELFKSTWTATTYEEVQKYAK